MSYDGHESPITDPAAAREKLWELINGIRYAMLTNRGTDGRLHSRPLTTQNGKRDDGTRAWFFISQQSQLAAELRQDASVNLAYADPSDDRYVSVSGTARAVDDPQKKRDLWTPMAQAFFPKGVDDPDLLLLAVDISDAEYWEAKSSKMVQFLRMATAAVTGNPPQDLSENRKLEVNSV